MVRIENQRVRLTDFLDSRNCVRGLEAKNCELVGPAVIVIGQGTRFSGKKLFNHAGGGADALLWEIDPARIGVVGAIAVEDCLFENCTFTDVGLAGAPEVIAGYAKAFFEAM